MTADDVFENEGCDRLCSGICQWFCFYPFCVVIDGNYNEAVAIFRGSLKPGQSRDISGCEKNVGMHPKIRSNYDN